MSEAARFYDRVARVFDEWQRQRVTESESTGPAPFYRDLAREVDGPALEVGVGGGQIYLELLADGVDVDGIDLSEGMLNVLREKAEERGLDPSVRVADVTDFEPDREYGLVYAPRVLNLSSLADQRAALRNVREALAPDGVLALNVFVPSFDVVAETFGEPSEETVEIDGVPHRVVMTTEFTDEVEQVVRWQWKIYRDGELFAERERHMSMVPKRQFELLFELEGYSDWTVYGDFDRNPLESTEQEMIWVVEA